jgi:chromosomal replication initiation ATPase DnaA
MVAPKEITKKRINIYAAVSMLNNKISPEEEFEHIIDVVIKRYKEVHIRTFGRKEPLTKELILSKNRSEGIVYIRQLISYYLYYKRVKLRIIGDLMGGQDHSTIINARDRFIDRLDTLSQIPFRIDNHRINTYEDYVCFKRLLNN